MKESQPAVNSIAHYFQTKGQEGREMRLGTRPESSWKGGRQSEHLLSQKEKEREIAGSVPGRRRQWKGGGGE